jgi:succinate dehydrogenase / fumarate reductase cytochrome b subunit
MHVLQQPISLAVYGLGALAIGLHLVHGAEAAHRSLGWLNPANKSAIRFGGRLLAALLSGGFLLISLGLALGTQA